MLSIKMILDFVTNSFSTDLISESFRPTYRENSNSLYEIMHCFGSGRSLLHIEQTIKNCIDSYIKEGIIVEPTVIFFNTTKMKTKPNYPESYLEIDCPNLMSQRNIIEWIDEISFCGVIFYGNDKSECEKLMMRYYGNYGPAGVANCVNEDSDDKIKCTVNMLTAYYDNETLGFIGATGNFRSTIYHEIMHKYQLLKSGGKVKYIDIINDRVCSDILRNYKMKKTKKLFIDKDEQGLYDLVQTIYNFSPRERSAFMGQQEVRFSDLDINTKDDFYDALENSEITDHIKTANDAIIFLNDYCNRETTNPFIDRNLKHIITKLTGDDEKGNLFKIVRKFIHLIQDEISDMKTDLHNIAYWSLDDNIKNKIVEDYIFRY